MSVVTFKGIIDRNGKVAQFAESRGREFVLNRESLLDRITNVEAGKANPDRDASQERYALAALDAVLGQESQSGKVSQPNVHADHVRVEGQRLRLNLASENREPSFRFAPYRQGFNFPVNRTVQFNLNVPNVRQSQLVSVKSISNLTKRHRVITLDRSKTWITRAALLGATKKPLKRKVYTLCNVLQDKRTHLCYIRTRLLDVRQLTILIKPRNRFTLKFPRFASLLKRGVVKLRAYGKVLAKSFCLPLSWVNSIAINLEHFKGILP